MSNHSQETESSNHDSVLEKFKTVFESGKADEMAELIRQTPEVKSRLNLPVFSFNAPAVVAAAAGGNRAMIDVLLDAGADINAMSDWPEGPFGVLHHLIDDTEYCQLLIDRGARVDVHAAVGLEHWETVREMANKSPSCVHLRGPDGQLPLHFARSTVMVDFLLAQGADLDARDLDHQSTAAQWAAVERPEICRYLIDKGAQFDLFLACALGDCDRITRELEREPEGAASKVTMERFAPGAEAGGNIYLFLFGEDASLLHVAAICNKSEPVSLLYQSGCDVNSRGAYDQCTPLHSCAASNHPDVARQLIASGADINLRSGPEHHSTALAWAVSFGSVEMVDLLLESGANVDDQCIRNAKMGAHGDFQWFAPVADLNVYVHILEKLKQG